MSSRTFADARGLLAVLGGLMIVAAGSNSSALTLACKPGVSKKTFVKKTFAVPWSKAAKLERQLTAWAEREGLSVSGGEFEDPDAKPPLRGHTTMLQSKSYGTVLQVETSNRSDTALVTVKNNCWAPQEDWRPYWQKLNGQLSRWDYRPSHR
jgi:hypothetical protein